VTSDLVAAEAAPRKGWLKLVLIVLSVLYGLALAPACLMAMMSPMMSDAGVTPLVRVAMAVTVTLPMALLLCPLAAWISYSAKRWRTAWVLGLAPLLWLAILLGYLATHAKV
jgi:hypothetical protein